MTGVFNFFPSDELPASITAGPDGALWFTENPGSSKGAPQIGRITTSGAITTFPVPADLQAVTTITPGPDGALWFTATNDDKIGRITTGGQVTEFPLPASADPQQITTGPDGNLWFTEFQRNMIGRITPDGAVTEFPLPGPSDGQANGITKGPDGNVWFTLPGNLTSHVGRITPGGVVSLFPVPAPPPINASPPRPERITTGPDGNLWFTDSLDRGVGRVTPAGVVTEFFNGFSGEPDAITTGSDGNLWVTTLSIDTVSRVTPAGVVTVFTLPGASTSFKFGGNPLLPVSITAGPDGNIWFTEAPPSTQLGQIGEVVLKNLVPPPPGPPVVTIARPGTLHAGSLFRTTGAFVSQAAGPFVAAVNYGDGTGLRPLTIRPDRTFSLAHVYASTGTYLITVGVKDRLGQVGRVSLRVTVSAPSHSCFGHGRDAFVTAL